MIRVFLEGRKSFETKQSLSTGCFRPKSPLVKHKTKKIKIPGTVYYLLS